MKPPRHRCTPTLMPFDQKQREAMRLLRGLAKERPERIYFGRHAEEQMDIRGISKLSAYRALAVGDPKGEWEPGRDSSESKLLVSYRAKGSREIVVVTVVVTKDEKAFVRTVYWSD